MVTPSETTIAPWESEKESWKKEAERIFEEIMAKISPNLVTYINLQVQEAPLNPNCKIVKGTIMRNIIKLLKDKE